MKIVLEVPGKTGWIREIAGDVSAFSVGALVEIEGERFPYRVGRCGFVLDKSGDGHFKIVLRSTKRWVTVLDEWAARYDIIYPLAGFALVFLVATPLALIAWFCLQSTDVQMAWAGWLIAHAQWPLAIGVFLVLYAIARRYSELGDVIFMAAIMLGTVLAVVAGIVWRQVFLLDYSAQWPAGYADLARRAWASSATLTAFAAAYLPLVLLIAKYAWGDVLQWLLRQRHPK